MAACAALSVLMTACGPLISQESPSPSPSVVTRATPRPTLTPRAAATRTPERTQRPPATPLATGAARQTPAVQTARPGLGLPVVNGTCSEWPRDAEIVTIMTRLALPPSLCLLRASSAQVGQIVCTVAGCVPVSAECAQTGSCVEAVETEHPHYVLVYIAPPPALPPSIAEGHALARHLCKLHQERTRGDATLRGRASPGWLATIEGTEFVSAFTFFRTAYAGDAERWGVRDSDTENYADVCTAWYYPSSREQKVTAYPALERFAQKWLPR